MTLEITNPTTMHMESAGRGNTMQKTHCNGAGGDENNNSRIESQELA